MKRVVQHARQIARSFDLRLDAGYTIGDVMDDLSDDRVRFCGRLKKLRNEFEDALGGCWDLRRFQQSVWPAGGRPNETLWLRTRVASGCTSSRARVGSGR